MAYKVTWLGHATYLLEIGEHSVLIDPYLDSNPSATVAASEINPDFILVSHGHGDHISDAAPIAKRTGVPIITNVEISRWLRDTQGVEEVHGHQPGASATYPFGHVEFTMAIHGSGLPDGAYGGLAMGFIITAEDKKAYFACDTGLFLDMQLYGERGLDVAFLPIGDYFTMGPDDALRSIEFLKPRLAIPKHYNTFPPIEQDGAAWAKRVSEETDAEGHEMSVNETIEL